MKMEQQRLLLYGALALALVLAVVVWGLVPLSEYRAGLAGQIDSAGQQLAQLYRLERAHQAEAKDASGLEAELAKRGQGFTLFAFLEQRATQDGIRGNIDYMRPSTKEAGGGAFTEEIVEMRLSNISLDKLIPYIYHVESSPAFVRVTRLVIRSHEKQPLDTDLVFSTFTKKGAG